MRYCHGQVLQFGYYTGATQDGADKMLKRLIACGTAAILLVGTACLTEGDPVLYVVVNSFVPDTTSEPQLGLSGEVHRTPQEQDAVMVVTVTGGVLTVVDTANLHGIFSLTVPLQTNAENDLSLTAHDNTGATTTGPWQRTVVHVDAGTALQSSNK